MTNYYPRRGSALLVALVAALVAGLVSHNNSASAQVSTDASCQAGQSTSQTNGYDHIAQSFTAQNSGQLTSADVVLNGVGNFTLEIRDVDSSGAPTSNVLATATVASPRISPKKVTGTFSSPATVVGGQQYALVVNPPSANNFGAQFSSDHCPGNLYLANSSTGGAFVAFSDLDMTFHTFVTTPATTGPTVTSTTPTAAQTGVARNTNVTATFSEDMDSSTINTSTFKLYQWNKKRHKWIQVNSASTTVSYDSPSTTATLDPYGSSTTLLAANKKYKAVVTTEAKDLAGDALDQDPSRSGNQQMSWTFTTGST